MNAHVFTGTEITTGRRKPSEIVAEYEMKKAALGEAFATFRAAGDTLKSAATIAGAWGNTTLGTGRVYESELSLSLLRSAWRHIYELYGLAEIMSAKDKAAFEVMSEKPPEFTVENIRDRIGVYVADPWGSILRGLAEVFCNLDPAFMSHEKMKIGVKGLPKRVIVSGYYRAHYSHGIDKVRDILNALAAYQGKPLVTHLELTALERDGEALRYDGDVPDPFQSRTERAANPRFVTVIGRGVWLKTYKNGNCHLYFDPPTLRDVNRALAEYYSEVLADCYDDDEARPARRESTLPAKDLQFYPTPAAVIDRVLSQLGNMSEKKVLEPSCGDGRIMDARWGKGVHWSNMLGVEIDGARAIIARVVDFHSEVTRVSA